MSEQNKSASYMHELNSWIQVRVITPLAYALSAEFPSDPRNEDEIEETIEAVKKAIREKVLESYHNGQKSGTRKPPRH
jgi:hypothetical protein